jgi:hypothetical protein
MTMAKAGQGIPRFSPNTRDVGFWAAAHTRCVIQVTVLHLPALSVKETQSEEYHVHE